MDKQTKDQQFRSLYLSHYPALERYCRAMAPDDDTARELLSQTVEKTYMNFNNLRDPLKFKYYMFGICSNLFKKWIRDKKRFVPLDILESQEIKGHGDEKLDIEVLYKAISQLNEHQGEIISLFELSGFKLHEIAEMKNMPLNTVKTHLSRAREQLRQRLSHEFKH